MMIIEIRHKYTKARRLLIYNTYFSLVQHSTRWLQSASSYRLVHVRTSFQLSDKDDGRNGSMRLRTGIKLV